MALDAMLIADDHGHYVEANPAACKLLGVAREHVLGCTIADFCVLPPGVDLGSHWQHFLEQGHMQGEISLRVGNGEERIVEFSATAHFCPHFHLSILRDVTERKQSEALNDQLNQLLTQQVKERTQELQTIQAQLKDEHALLNGILSNINGVVWSVDLPSRVTRYVNSAVETLYGYSTDAFLKNPSLWQSLIHPDDQPKINQCLSQLASQSSFDLEYRITRSDGVVRWVRDRSKVTYDIEGTPIRLDGIATDITEQKQLEEALRLSESQMEAIFQQAAIGINQAGPDGRFLQANQAYCDLLGYDKAELLQLRFQDVSHSDEYKETEAALAKLYAGEAASVTLEKRHLHKDGSERWTNIVLSILRDADGQAISDLAVVQDISDRKRIEQAIEEERSLFIGGPTVVIRWSPRDGWPIGYVSPNVQAQFGYEPNALVQAGVNLASLIHPDDIDQIQAEVTAATAAQDPCRATEYRLRHANGEYRWINEFARFIYTPNGRVAKVLGYIQDITERKQIELDLQQSEATKQAMLEAIPDLLLRINRHGLRFDFISGGEVTVHGNVDTQIAQSIYDTLPKALADQRLHFLHQALDTGKRQIYEHTIDIDGNRYYEETRIVPLGDEEALVMVRDVTNRVTAELALRESQQRFQAIFDQMYQFIGLLTPDGTLLEINQTALAFGGFEREDVVGRPIWDMGWWDVVSLEAQAQLKGAIAQAAQGEFVRYEVTIQGANQQVMTLDFSLRPVLDDQGQVVLLIPEGRDLTQRKHMEEELRRTKVFLEQTSTVAQVGGWEVNLQQGLVYWTPITREIHEVEADFEPTLMTMFDFYPDGVNRQRITAVVAHACQTGQPWDEKLQIVTAKGNLRWVRSLGQAERIAGECVRIYGALQNIDAQMQAEIRLHELTQQLQQAQRMAQLGNWWFDSRTETLHWSAEIFRLLGVSPDKQPFQLEDRPDLLHPDDFPRWKAHIQAAYQNKGTQELDMRILRPDGEMRYVHARTYTDRHQDQSLNLQEASVQLFGTLVDVTDRKQAEICQEELFQQLQQANAELHRIATTDALTQVANRRYFDQVLAQEWGRAKHDRASLALIMCDVDYFKPYNDNYGHPAGDQCLQQVAELLTAAVERPRGLMARYGGEEFVVLLPATAISEAIEVVTRIQHDLTQARLPHEFSLIADQITLSFGLVCCVPSAQNGSDALLAAADVALYQAKLRGRNQYCIGSVSYAEGLER
jgi:diguanylate cyclase (GGDEF)-like protein/PAS domain S-box-containing protein